MLGPALLVLRRVPDTSRGGLMAYGNKEEFRTTKNVPVFPQPIIAARHIECTLCSWCFNPRLGGVSTPMVIKLCNANCWHSRISGMNQRENPDLLCLLETS
jgi:hypothetical protein